MASDLFHDVARAYYGVSAELYTLANIATNGAAPEGYALGDGGQTPPVPYHDPSQIDWESLGKDGARAKMVLGFAKSWAAKTNDPSLDEGYRRTAGMAAHHNYKLARQDLQKMGYRLPYRPNFESLPTLPSWWFDEPSEDADTPSKSLEPQPAETKSTAGGYKKPELPPPPKQPKSMPGQKSLFACSQPYALGDSNTGSADDDPMMKRRGASGMYPAQPRPMSSFGTRITLAGDYPSKPDFSETGTGGHVTADESVQPESKYAIAPPPPPPMPTSKPKYPATSVLKAPPPPPPMSKPTKPNFRETGTGTILPPPKMATPTGSKTPTKSPAETKGLADASARFVAKVRESTPEARAAEDRRWKALEAKWVEDVLKANHEPPVKMNHPLSRGLLPVV